MYQNVNNINILFIFQFFTDGIGKFSIIGPKELVIKGDDVEFTCVASVSYYTDQLRWENLNKTLLVESGKLLVKTR